MRSRKRAAVVIFLALAPGMQAWWVRPVSVTVVVSCATTTVRYGTDRHVGVARRAIDCKLADGRRMSTSFTVTVFSRTYVANSSSAVTSVTPSRFVHSMDAPTV